MYRWMSIFIFSCLFSVISNAAITADENNTLYVTLINNTHDVLNFTRVVDQNAGNLIAVEPVAIHPGETGVVTAEKTLFNDVFARLIFITQENVELALLLLDQEQMHMGQPIFNVTSPKHKSKILSRTRNPTVGPRYLTYVAATIEVSQE